MAIQDKISIETRFQLNNNINFKITDDTDYASEGIATTDVEGALTITDRTGTMIHQTLLPASNIDVNVQDYIDTILLPLDSNGDVIEGNYVITYTIRVIGGVQPGDYTKSFTYDYCYEAPTAVIDVEVNLISSTLTSTDNTPYPAEMTGSTLTHTVYPPRGVDAGVYPPNVVSTAINVYTPIFTKTWTATISNIIELEYSDGLIVEDTITGNVEKTIKDDINICNLQCNLRALGDRYNHALQYNPINADRIAREQLTPALFNSFMYTSNIQCGNFDKAEQYYQKVLLFTGSQPDCSCSDSDTPTLITASVGGGGGDFVVAVSGANNALSVTSVTVGDTTTYTLLFNNTMFNKITALTETSVTSTDGTVTVVETTPSGYLKNYDLSVVEEECFFAKVTFTFSSGNVPTYTLDSVKTYGTTFTDAVTDAGGGLPIIENINDASASDWQSNYVQLKVQNFFTGAAADYYPEITVIQERTVGQKAALSSTKKFIADIFTINSSDFRVRFVNPTPAIGRAMDALSQLTLIIKIQA